MPWLAIVFVHVAVGARVTVSRSATRSEDAVAHRGCGSTAVEHVDHPPPQVLVLDVAPQLEEAVAEGVDEAADVALHLADLLGDLRVVMAAWRHELSELGDRAGEIGDGRGEHVPVLGADHLAR